MSKITLTNLVNLENQTTAVNAINNNNSVLTTAFDNTLSRDGTSPNTMGSSLDMNSHQIINLPPPSTNNSPLRLIDGLASGGIQGPAGVAGPSGPPSLLGGALSVVSGDPAPEADTTTSIIYLVPADNPGTESWNGTSWVPYTYTGELLLTLTAGAHLANTNYDIFETPNNGVMVLYTGPAWTNDTTRSMTIENFQGHLVNANSFTGTNGAGTFVIAARAANLRGGFRASANGQTKSTKSTRLLSDLLKPTIKPVYVTDATASWVWSTAAFQQANASSVNRIAVFNCASGRTIDVNSIGYMVNSTATIRAGSTGIGVDSSSVDSTITSTPAVGNNAAPITPGRANYTGYTGLGYHEYRWLEKGAGADVQTWYGTNLPTKAGLSGSILQ